MNGALIFLACLPGIIFLIFIYKVDRFNKEPIKLLIGLFLMGIVAIIPAILLEQLFVNLNFFQGVLGLAVEAFVITSYSIHYTKLYDVYKAILHVQIIIILLYNKQFLWL